MPMCPACQERLPDDARFCGVCGFRLKSIVFPSGGTIPEPLPATQKAEPTPDLVAVSEHRAGEPGRQFRRFPLKVEVNLGSDHNFYTGFTQNISGGGLFVATHEVAGIGDALCVVFSIPGLPEPYRAQCEVKWVRDVEAGGRDAAPGMGLRFLELDCTVAQAIDAFINHRDPIFFEE